jgi:hypothetical protein
LPYILLNRAYPLSIDFKNLSVCNFTIVWLTLRTAHRGCVYNWPSPSGRGGRLAAFSAGISRRYDLLPGEEQVTW